MKFINLIFHFHCGDLIAFDHRVIFIFISFASWVLWVIYQQAMFFTLMKMEQKNHYSELLIIWQDTNYQSQSKEKQRQGSCGRIPRKTFITERSRVVWGYILTHSRRGRRKGEGGCAKTCMTLLHYMMCNMLEKKRRGER